MAKMIEKLRTELDAAKSEILRLKGAEGLYEGLRLQGIAKSFMRLIFLDEEPIEMKGCLSCRCSKRRVDNLKLKNVKSNDVGASELDLKMQKYTTKYSYCRL